MEVNLRKTGDSCWDVHHKDMSRSMWLYLSLYFSYILTHISHTGIFWPHPLQIPEFSGDQAQNSKATLTHIQPEAMVVIQRYCVDSVLIASLFMSTSDRSHTGKY